MSATSATLLPLLAAGASPKLELVDPLLREALLESAFSKVQDAGIAPPFQLRGGLARRVLDLVDAILARAPLQSSESGLDRFFARALEELDAPDDEGALKLAAQTRFLRAAVEEYRAALAALGLADSAAARLALSGKPLPFERAFVLGAETLALADLDLLSNAPINLTMVVATPSNELESELSRRFSVVNGERRRSGLAAAASHARPR